MSIGPVRSAVPTIVADNSVEALASQNRAVGPASPRLAGTLVAKRQTGTVYRTEADFNKWLFKDGNVSTVAKTLVGNGITNVSDADAKMLAGLVYVAKGSKLPGTIPSVAGSLLTELAAMFKTFKAALATGNPTQTYNL